MSAQEILIKAWISYFNLVCKKSCSEKKSAKISPDPKNDFNTTYEKQLEKQQWPEIFKKL
jgi:hypothetical protein